MAINGGQPYIDYMGRVKRWIPGLFGFLILDVITVWIELHATGEVRFVTLVPDKEPGR